MRRVDAWTTRAPAPARPWRSPRPARRVAARPKRSVSIVTLALERCPDARDALRYLSRLLDTRSAVERVRLWLDAHPDRKATHVEIAAETGLRREAVTRAFRTLRPAPVLLRGEAACACGCGRATRIADKADPIRGYAKGDPRRFVRGHHG